jgi:hypothetical protein
MSLGIIEDRWFGVPPEAVDETFPFPPPQVGENARGFCKALRDSSDPSVLPITLNKIIHWTTRGSDPISHAKETNT